MKRLLLACAATLALAAAAAPAAASDIAYVAQYDPWGNTTNDAAMDAAFGAGNWDRLTSYDNSIFTGGYAFLYVDGGDSNGQAFGDWLNGGGATAAEAYVVGGGALFLNAAYNGGPEVTNTGFGSTLHYGNDWSGAAEVTADGVSAGLSDGGAGTSFTGGSFSHNSVGGGFTTLITGDYGPILASGLFGAGRLTVGGQTTTNFHGGDDPAQLRVNELTYAASVSGVPEPASWGLMFLGVAGLGVALRAHRRADKRLRDLEVF